MSRQTQQRAAAIAAFLREAGWGRAERAPLAGDASFRRYDRLRRGAEQAVLMDAPPPHEDVRPFVHVAELLRERGLSVPAILAKNEDAGLLLLEDFGDASYTRLLRDGGDEVELYRTAIDVLVELHRAKPPAGIQPYSDDRLLLEIDLLLDWYLPALTGHATEPALRDEFHRLWRAVLPRTKLLHPVLVLRDYHADNLMWLPGREGARRTGLLDFQDALYGSPAYDMVSLLDDVRREVPPLLAESMIKHYVDATGVHATSFRDAYAILGAQRNTKILGIFTRLWKRDGKAHYPAMLPRVWQLLETELQHPALAPLKHWFDQHVTPEQRLKPLPGLGS